MTTDKLPMTFDVDDLTEFDALKKETSYDGLLNSAKKIDQTTYERLRVYKERHHVVPKCEGKSDEVVFLPVKYHFLAHVFRAREHEKAGDVLLAYKNYISANVIAGNARVNKANGLKRSIDRTLDDLKTLYDVKKKVYEGFLLVRNPYVRNVKTICLETHEVFESSRAASDACSISYGNLSSIVNGGPRTKAGGKHWAKYDETKPFEYYDDLLKRALEKEKTKHEDRHVDFLKRPVLAIETNETFACVKDAMTKYPHACHVVECCNKDTVRKTTGGFHWEWIERGENTK